MRRTIPVALGLALVAILGLATPAGAETTPSSVPPARPAVAATIQLTCAATATTARPTIHCEWAAFSGATAYRVTATAVHGRRGNIRIRRTTVTSFTTPAVRPGRYAFLVVAVGADHKPLARSNRAQVIIKAANRPGATATASASVIGGGAGPRASVRAHLVAPAA